MSEVICTCLSLQRLSLYNNFLCCRVETRSASLTRIIISVRPNLQALFVGTLVHKLGMAPTGWFFSSNFMLHLCYSFEWSLKSSIWILYVKWYLWCSTNSSPNPILPIKNNQETPFPWQQNNRNQLERLQLLNDKEFLLLPRYTVGWWILHIHLKQKYVSTLVAQSVSIHTHSQ